MKAVLLAVMVVAAPAIKILDADKDTDLKVRPVAKVVNLLKDMTAQLQKEAEADAEAYEQMACWCETGDKQKAAAISDANTHIAELTSSIEEYTAKSQQLSTDIESLTTELAAQNAALTQATAIRDKERAEFVAEEKDMIQSITGLKGAVITLGRAHGEDALVQVQELLKKHAHKHLLTKSLTASQRRMVLGLVQEHSTAHEQQTPASGEIFGVLKQMKESFETNLAGSQKEESQAETEYDQLKTAKTSEIAAGEKKKGSKTVELGDADQFMARASQDLKETKQRLAADEQFLADLKSKCATADQDYAARLKVRTEEIQAVSDTINILTSDEANDSFTKSMSFLQRTSTAKRAADRRIRQQAVNVLKKAAQKTGHPELATLAVSMREDVFTKVKQNIDNMVTALKEEQKDEVSDRDYCIENLNVNERQTAEKWDEKNNLDAKIASLTSNIAQLTDELKALAAEITETQVNMKKASETRSTENKEFQTTIEDQRATQEILKKALDRLGAFYGLQAGSSQPGQPLSAPPEQKTYSKGNGGGAMAMIEDVMKESKALENDAIAAESDSQAAYEVFMKDSNKLISSNQEQTASKSEAKAKSDAELALAKGDLKTTGASILSLGDVAKELHNQCDFLLKNFEERQSSRTQEMDALNQAKAIFSGAK